MGESRTKTVRAAPAIGVWPRIALFIALAVATPGCLLDRVLASRQQVCDGRYTLDFSDGTFLRLDRGILRESDVACLVDAEPTSRADGRLLYLMRNRSEPDPRFEIPIELYFDRVGDESLLRAGYAGKSLTEVLSESVIAQATRAACDGRISLLHASVTFDLTAIDRASLPRREQLVALLGKPSASARPGSIAFDYELVGSGGDRTARIELRFDDGGAVSEVDVRYLAYHLEADLAAGTGRFVATRSALGCAVFG
jgi:hypothetical protein